MGRNDVENSPVIGTEDEISLTDLFRNIWRQRGLVLAITAAMAALVLVYHLGKASFAVPSRVDYPVALTFINEKGTYPNGSVFSPRDLIAPAVIKRLLADHSDITVPSDVLLEALSVRYSNPVMDSAEQKLAALLANAKTPEEIRTAAQTTLTEMRDKTRSFLTVSLDLSEAGLAIPQGEKLVAGLVTAWADLSLTRGLGNVDIDRPVSAFAVQPAMNLIDMYDGASKYLDSLKRAVSQLAQQAGSSSLIIDGRTLEDIQRDIDALDVTDIGPLREFAYSNSADLASSDPAIKVRLFARQRLLNLEHERLSKLIVSYDAALSQLSQSARGLSKGQGLGGTSGDVQLDQSLLESMLSLGNKLGDVEMRQELFERRTKATEDMLSLEKELAILNGSATNQYGELDSEEILQAALPGITEGLNRLQQQIDAFFVAYRDQSLQSNGRLYVADSAPQVRGGHVQFASRIGLHLALGVVLGGMLGVLIALVRAAMVTSRSRG
ncbi:MAG: hypothetical protein KYX62_00665 [Pseudomonadota bacterium]|nr:hypothetical protein [Pseudomonadota bacterium]